MGQVCRLKSGFENRADWRGTCPMFTRQANRNKAIVFIMANRGFGKQWIMASKQP